MDHDTVTDDAHLVGALDLAFLHEAAGHGAHLRDLEDLQHLEVTADLLPNLGREHALHSRTHLLDGVVDDGVEADLDALLVGQLAGGLGWAHLEADDDGAG